MTGFFNNNELVKLIVTGNSETIYWVREEDGTLTGINKAFSSNMSIWFHEKKIDKITYLEKPIHVLYPESDLGPADLLLKDFEWHGDRRPLNRYDIFKWD